MNNSINPNRFYVYLLLDPRKDVLTPFYVGKGQGRRVHAHFNPSSMRRSHNTFKNAVITKIKSAGMKPPHFIYANNLTQDEALLLERILITRFGRRDIGTGILTNLTDGGEGPLNLSPESREKMRQRMTGAGSPTFGVGHTDEARKKMSQSQKERVEKGLVTRHSEEWKQHLRENNAGGKATRKSVCKFTQDGKLVETFESMASAARSVGMTKNNFSFGVVKDGSIPRGEHFYRYEDSTDITEDGIKNADKLILKRERHTRGAVAGKSVKKTTDHGVSIIYESIKEASRDHPNIKYATLWAAINYERKCADALWAYC